MDKQKQPEAPPMPPPLAKPLSEKQTAPAPAKERVSGQTTVKVFEHGTGRPLEIVRMRDAGTEMDIFVNTK